MSGRFNLGSRRAADTADLDVLDPVTDEPTGWLITFAGPGHAQTNAQDDRLERERLTEEREMTDAQASGKKWRPAERSRDQRATRNVLYIVERIVGWTPIDLDGEEDVKFSPETATRVLADPQMAWLYRQCLAFLVSDKSFIRRSSTA